VKRLGNKIEKILSTDSENLKLKLKYTDGIIGEVDLSSIFSRPKGLASEVIKGQLFEKCFVESGSLAWPNGLELCADSLKLKLITKKKGNAA
jgi:hypothetical protein